MWPVKVEYFSFWIFDDKTELVKKFGQYIITAEKIRVWNINQFVLRNNKTIIYERNDRNGNVEIF